MNKAEKIIQSIKEKGLAVSKVERTAGVEKGTLRRWANNPPKTMVTVLGFALLPKNKT